MQRTFLRRCWVGLVSGLSPVLADFQIWYRYLPSKESVKKKPPISKKYETNTSQHLSRFGCNILISRRVDGSLGHHAAQVWWVVRLPKSLLSITWFVVGGKIWIFDDILSLPVDICKIPGGVTDPKHEPYRIKHDHEAQKEKMWKR